MNKPRYEYTCAQCGGEVTKHEPCGKILGRNKESMDSIRAGLHGWRCRTDGKGVAVKRKLKEKHE